MTPDTTEEEVQEGVVKTVAIRELIVDEVTTYVVSAANGDSRDEKMFSTIEETLAWVSNFLTN